MPTHFSVFLLTTLLLTAIPGPGQALMIRQTLGAGPRCARSAIAGTATGLMVWSTAAAIGLSAVFLADPRAYGALRIAGGVVLVVLGVNTLRSLRKSLPTADHDAGTVRPDHLGAYVAGLGTTLCNPKAGVFAVSILPQFVADQGPVLLSSIFLGAVWALVNASWYLLLTWAVNRGRELVARPTVRTDEHCDWCRPAGAGRSSGFGGFRLGMTTPYCNGACRDC
ncbi:LysE family translocator [Streptomyces spiralis]